MLPDDLELSLVETWDDAQSLMAWLGERRGILACDTETSGFDWWREDLRLVQFGDTRAGWAVPWEGWPALVREIFERYDQEIVFHNAKFDLHFLETAGCRVKRHLVHDTAVMAHLLEPHDRIGLKEVARRHVDPNAAAGQSELKKAMSQAGWTWGTVPLDFGGFWHYSALDPVLTAYVYETLAPKVRASFRQVYDLEMACMTVLLDMETRGARIDRAYCQQKHDELLAYAAQARAWLEAEHNTAPSGKRLAAALLKAGVPLKARTPTGAWKMDEEVLSGIDHPIAETALKVRRSEKWANAYFGNFLSGADAADRVHPSVRALGAVTGRMSVTNPALQTLPRGRLVRDAFIASEGHVLLGADFEQIEARLVTHYSQDAGLIAAFADTVDFFTSMARQIYGDPALEKADPRRQITKNAVYARAYGAGVSKFAATAGVDEGDARQFLDMMDRTFPGMRRFQHEVELAAKTRLATEGIAYALTMFGRRQIVPAGKEYKLVNAIIQGTAADLFKQVLVDMDAAGVADYLILPVHDEVVLDVPEDIVTDVQQQVLDVMEDHERFAVPILADPHTGHRWGDLK